MGLVLGSGCGGIGIGVKLIQNSAVVYKGVGCESIKECELICSEFLSHI
jgi:hypothetical protein